VTSILHILKFGTRYRVLLACVHQVELSPDELKQRQWYIGRRVECEECGREAKSKPFSVG
jgi:hypothetical protein